MTKLRVISALLTTILLVVPAASQVVPPDAKQWSVHHETLIQTGIEYELYNRSSQLGHGRSSSGVDLAWVQGHLGGLWIFMHQAPPRTRDHRRRPISTDDKVALFNTRAGRYLGYYSRGSSRMAEITWYRTPVYEWMLRDQSTSEGRVNFALYNVRAQKYLANWVQDSGINLGWFVPPAGPRSFSVPLSAQQIIQGWIPYVGKFGESAKGNLLTVQNAHQSATLLFVKPGKSTTDCSDSNATVQVAPRTMLTADQMKTLYGSTSPRLPINFLACVTTPTPQSIQLTFLNITYKLDP
ncbi:MAG TPA: hypothetical protein VJM12_00130 [Pyrinomonadaceae bacterium]|nr:hypothetical protein [Pyrinomonadaceae bacterium]